MWLTPVASDDDGRRSSQGEMCGCRLAEDSHMCGLCSVCLPVSRIRFYWVSVQGWGSAFGQQVLTADVLYNPQTKSGSGRPCCDVMNGMMMSLSS